MKYGAKPRRPTVNAEQILIYKDRNGIVREILPHNYWINRRTPVGEDAELWERKPHGGKRLLEWNRVIKNKAKEAKL